LNYIRVFSSAQLVYNIFLLLSREKIKKPKIFLHSKVTALCKP